MTKQYPIVEVEWEDAIACGTKFFIVDLIKEPVPLTKSCGYLIYEDDIKIILASMMYEDILEQHQTIPKGMIKKITKLRKW